MRGPAWCLCLLLMLHRAHAEPAAYRFETLVDRDQSALTGCDVATPAGSVHGKELRILIDTDRAQVQRIRYESCEFDQWREVSSDSTVRPLGLGQGGLGGDTIEWSIERSLLAGAAAIDLQLFAQNINSHAYDVLGRDGEFETLGLPTGGSLAPIPLFGNLGLVLLCLCLVLIAARYLNASRGRATLCLLVAVTAGLTIVVSMESTTASVADSLLNARDRANDSVGTDAGVDLLAASIRTSPDGLVLRIEVNNIEDDGLRENARVLFIGNSLTIANNLPAMLSAVAAQAGKNVATTAVTAGGFSLEDHFRAGNVQREIGHGYQLVILQQGPSALEESQANLLQWSIRFNTLIRASGARPALYMVWPERVRFNAFDDVRDSYSNAALAIDGMFIPGGEAWRASWQIDPTLALYGSDAFHPSALGTYAVALSMFAELYRQTPVDLPASITLANGVRIDFDPVAARAVQEGAWRAHLQFGRAGH